MPSLDAILAGGTTALGLALIGLWMFVSEKIVPKGRLDAAETDRDEAKTSAKESMAIARVQTEANLKLADAVKELGQEIRNLPRRPK